MTVACTVVPWHTRHKVGESCCAIAKTSKHPHPLWHRLYPECPGKYRESATESLELRQRKGRNDVLCKRSSRRAGKKFGRATSRLCNLAASLGHPTAFDYPATNLMCQHTDD